MLFKYIDNEGDAITFVIDPDESDKQSAYVYNQFINGLYIGNKYTNIEIHRLMDNGYKWEVI